MPDPQPAATNPAPSANETPVLQLLRTSEAQDPYGAPLVAVPSNGEDIFVISDTHMGPGRDENGCYNATENFFADEAFERFLQHLTAVAAGPAVLVINGDLVDFIRIAEVPRSDQAFLRWQSSLQEVGVHKTLDELRASVSRKERTFGLKTDDWKSIWKLDRALDGHAHAYHALAGWIALGNRVYIVKGNHDLEWYWPLVRNFFRLRLAQWIAAQGASPSVEAALATHILPRLTFIDDAMVFDSIAYVEHGHRYDRYTQVIGKPVLENGRELNIPFGSFLNRYMLNTVELAFPYADNVRPTPNLLPLLFRERFFVAIKLLFCHVPFMLLIIPKGYYRYLFTRLLIFVAILGVFGIGVPLVLLLSHAVNLSFFTSVIPQKLNFPGSSILASMLSVGFSYFMTRVVAYFQLSEPSSLAVDARKQFADHAAYRLVTMGHTHDPDQFHSGSDVYYNTGTWIPIIELDTAQVREDMTYTFLWFRCAPGAPSVQAEMRRWNDDAVRVDPLIIRKPKPDQPD